ncbi:hypothetical protein GCM10017056_08340 [Seohaeicola zhoushanensis]|uniref:Uncharacterized protein n=1 Tax=Seohaeicola zhoushanensis TaxID=1569283 RepID=A0A8J3GUH5_9RHOB|nr:hypothetical protein GCM10017056_08340 [Seohaeicola zhoushanensis]
MNKANFKPCEALVYSGGREVTDTHTADPLWLEPSLERPAAPVPKAWGLPVASDGQVIEGWILGDYRVTY